MSRRGVGKGALASGLAALLLGTAACSTVRKVETGVSLLFSSSPPSPVAQSTASPRVKELIDTMFAYAKGEKAYFSVDNGDTTFVFDNDLHEMYDLIPDNEEHLYFFGKVLDAQRQRREGNFDLANQLLTQASYDLATTLNAKSMNEAQLAQVKTPFDYAQAIWLLYNEVALGIVNKFQHHALTGNVEEQLDFADQCYAHCINIAPTRRLAIIASYQRSELEKVVQEHSQVEQRGGSPHD